MGVTSMLLRRWILLTVCLVALSIPLMVFVAPIPSSEGQYRLAFALATLGSCALKLALRQQMFRVIPTGEIGIVERFRQFSGATGPGVLPVVPFIETVRTVPTSEQTYTRNEPEVLTSDGVVVGFNILLRYSESLQAALEDSLKSALEAMATQNQAAGEAERIRQIGSGLQECEAPEAALTARYIQAVEQMSINPSSHIVVPTEIISGLQALSPLARQRPPRSDGGGRQAPSPTPLGRKATAERADPTQLKSSVGTSTSATPNANGQEQSDQNTLLGDVPHVAGQTPLGGTD